MKPNAFEYFAPNTVKEAVGLLERYEDEAKILAGGQSLVPIMNFRLGRPEVLVDINGIQDLDYIKEKGEALLIGALTRERDLELSPLVKEKCPILAEAVSFIGHVPIRNRGTIGGSLVHADPSSELPTVICCLNGEMRVVSPLGERALAPEEFFLTYLTTSLEPSEILIEVRVPTLPQNTAWSFVELTRRSGDFAIVGVATVLFMEDGGVCREARIALGGVAPTPVRAEEAEELLSGQVITEELIQEAGEEAAEATETEPDYHASAEYRKDMARVFVQRGLHEALSKVKGGK
ncbi:MAG: xanthine dehydrogenase family protein subunit M [Desulfobacteraceae bacterium]|jgi:carbon-monoxide dehydrogenase medium subunit/2-furoyl-CoA dehydrogenase FAD binding subunit